MKTVIEYAGEFYSPFHTKNHPYPFKGQKEYRGNIHPAKVAILLLDGQVYFDKKIDAYRNNRGWIKIKKTILE